MRVRFMNDVRRRFAALPQVNPRNFAGLTAFQQALVILREGNDSMRKDVVLMDDPAAVRGFRSVHRQVLGGCATAQCHGSMMGGNFVLFPLPDDNAALYTNFHLLAKYSSRPEIIDEQPSLFGGESVTMRMIDRQRPEKSLLLQYGLPQHLAESPHPQVPGFKPMFRDRRDAMYNRILTWIADDLRTVDVVHPVEYRSPVEMLFEPLPTDESGPETPEQAE
jgi:hypothetical protein